MRIQTLSFRNRSDTNQAVQAQKMARGWKFSIKKLEVLYYLCSENKGADLCLCFRICKVCFLMMRVGLMCFTLKFNINLNYMYLL